VLVEVVERHIIQIRESRRDKGRGREHTCMWHRDREHSCIYVYEVKEDPTGPKHNANRQQPTPNKTNPHLTRQRWLAVRELRPHVGLGVAPLVAGVRGPNPAILRVSTTYPIHAKTRRGPSQASV